MSAYFYGENEPVSRVGNPQLPPGYDYDGVNRDALMSRMTVGAPGTPGYPPRGGGRLLLPDGISYRLLVLPPDDTMTPELLGKIGQLVSGGATVVGRRPVRSPSLRDYPHCDAAVQSLAGEIWGDCDGKTVTEHAYGKGRVVWGKPLEKVLAERGAGPDCDFGAAGLNYIHRQVADSEVYFVANPAEKATRQVQCSFRVAGKTPHFFYPDRGTIENVPVFTEEAGRTRMTAAIRSLWLGVRRLQRRCGRRSCGGRGVFGRVVVHRCRRPPRSPNRPRTPWRFARRSIAARTAPARSNESMSPRRCNRECATADCACESTTVLSRATPRPGHAKLHVCVPGGRQTPGHDVRRRKHADHSARHRRAGRQTRRTCGVRPGRAAPMGVWRRRFGKPAVSKFKTRGGQTIKAHGRRRRRRSSHWADRGSCNSRRIGARRRARRSTR